MGMLDSADRQRSGLSRVFLRPWIGTHNRRSAGGADRIDGAEPPVADGVREFSGASHPDWHGSLPAYCSAEFSRPRRCAG